MLKLHQIVIRSCIQPRNPIAHFVLCSEYRVFHSRKAQPLHPIFYTSIA